MPAANGALSNCVRLTLKDSFYGYIPTKQKALLLIGAIEVYRGISFLESEIKIESWFIEGEF